MPAFYIFGFCYMGVRLYCNLFGTLLPFYLVDVLEIGNKEQIKNNEIPFQVALVGLILYLSQYIVSLFTIKIYTKFGRKKTLFAGLTLCFGTSLTMVFINPWSSGVMYAIAVFIGIAETLVLSTGINLISDVVGLKSKKGALVFGVYSFADKFASGLAIYFITVSPLFESSVSYKKWTIILIPSLACILSCTMVLLSPVKEYNQQPPPDTVALKLNSSDIDLVI
jgi:MFS family permease